jgi:L-seryl-tRNA(Ser) seleniumtransferase
LLLGRVELVERLRRHPLARALRVDKLTLAALEATLTGPASPVGLALASDPAALTARAVRLAEAIGSDLAEAVPSRAAVGGGGAPGVTLASAAVALPVRLAGPLRTGHLPVVGHVTDGRLLLDLITVPRELDPAVAEAVRLAAKG